ncbi:hypothetical protein RRG08_034187 [Elysia crispata]|uniref:Uncharacterized protein n=1 Tax=Elysia crispata TaxID=231223 RepID=A0AAE1BAV0_9GAST|nr:hypothetical protein RRG08_034187 [Elysia crispata]
MAVCVCKQVSEANSGSYDVCWPLGKPRVLSTLRWMTSHLKPLVKLMTEGQASREGGTAVRHVFTMTASTRTAWVFRMGLRWKTPITSTSLACFIRKGHENSS